MSRLKVPPNSKLNTQPPNACENDRRRTRNHRKPKPEDEPNQNTERNAINPPDYRRPKQDGKNRGKTKRGQTEHKKTGFLETLNLMVQNLAWEMTGVLSITWIDLRIVIRGVKPFFSRQVCGFNHNGPVFSRTSQQQLDNPNDPSNSQTRK